MPRSTWETERRVKPDIWRGNESSRTDEERSSNSFHVERRSQAAVSLSGEILQDVSSSTFDEDEQPGAFAINRDGVDPLTLDWDQNESFATRDSQSKPLEDSTRDDIMPFFIQEKKDKSKREKAFCCIKIERGFTRLAVLCLLTSLIVIVVVVGLITSAKLKAKNSTKFHPFDKCDFSTISPTTQIDPILQCECHKKVEHILDKVASAYGEIRNAANMTDETIDIHSCSVENVALLWAATEYSMSGEISSNKRPMETIINRLGLAFMFLSWGGNYWTNKANWMKPDSECVWFGVTCDTEKRVVALGLSNNNLKGTLGTQLGLIRNLVKIDISVNQMQGTIHPSWWNLDKLASLNLSKNEISGTFPPLQNGNGETLLPFLEEFDVSDNQMRGSIFTDIHELTNLRVLSLMQNEISGTFPPFTSNSLLHSLSLSETLIGGTIPTYWYNLTQLENLDLFNLATAIGNFSLFLQMTKLINLRIGGEVDTAGDWGALPEKIGALSQLEGIDTSYAWRSGTVPTTIGLLTNLKRLIVSGSGITGTLPSEIGRCSHLQKLVISNTGIASALPTEIGQLSFLNLLDISFNMFLRSTLPTEFSLLSRLTSLYIVQSGIVGTVPPKFCSIAGRKIYVGNVNQLNGCSCCATFY